MHTEGDITNLLDPLTLLALTEEEAEELVGDIMLQEIRAELKSLVRRKTPGMDGFPVEMYIMYSDVLAPTLVEVHRAAKDLVYLPPPTRKELVVPLLKPGRTLHSLKTYRPLLMLNIEYKKQPDFSN
ncbi:hypothetical protein NDU88_006028 [Pleurodeles waltl]|uniref:Uncharacterized protein n=1 Tax=Pleurodeles waltl TaxID=8319 RepID=A0AAV7RKU3_PLEWA|nr:hypothetical protein NDU88_006028 [Pleurodeles waltl]